ncbi:response regulator [Candidatus Gracilibacteria bacterium]|nr:response regulator [Candidatus Gracilibacteria bacterium]NJP20583.1 response regulator [Hydrococcus sp. CRU_1_1]
MSRNKKKQFNTIDTTNVTPPIMTNVDLSHLTFSSRELPSQLISRTKELSTGYWQFKLTDAPEAGDPQASWYLAIVQGRVVFSGTQPLSWQSLCQTLQRYLPSLRTASAKQTLKEIEKDLSTQELKMLSQILLKAEKALSLQRQEVVKAIHLQILSDLDTYLFDASGKGRYLVNNSLVLQTPFSGFKLEDLIFQAQARQEEWRNLRRYIASMQGIPILNTEALTSANVAPEQRQLIEKLTNLGKPLNSLAQITAKDPLETAKMFAKLIERGFVTLQIPPEIASKFATSEVFIIDDSPIFLQKFQAVVSKWGYRVNAWNDPATAIEKIMQANPSIIFMDINMPGMSGFDLIKEIRRQQQLANIHLVMLTAENSLSNQWRAKWGNCKFIAKPRSQEEIANFQVELRQLLQEIAPLYQ